MNNFLFRKVDNINLVLFRVIFGYLITLEAFGAIATGWVRKVLVQPDFTFNFIGLDFLQYFQGEWMYLYFIIMGIFGIAVTLGYQYRISMLSYALLWSGVYLMQKSSYNNHYYLMMLLCWMMAFLPANRSFSIDSKRNPEKRSLAMPRWVLLVLILQVWIVYTYASLNKLYPGWLDGSAIATFMAYKINYPYIGQHLQNSNVQQFMLYTGIIFDLLVVPMLLWRKTRTFAFVVSILFHLSNSIIFQIGIFPYMSIAFSLFFFPAEILRKRFLRKREIFSEHGIEFPKYKKVFVAVFTTYFIFQVGLPIRHYWFEDDVLWTEEGHRLSWRMMLRARKGTLNVYVENKDTGKREKYNYPELLSPGQQSAVRSKADMMWQLAQKIKEIEAEKGNDVAVYMESMVSINNGPYHAFTDPTVDLASEKWSHFRHSSWILPSPPDLSSANR